MKVIVVTGGIGSGKSLVCRFLSEHDIPVYDSDSRAKALYRHHPSLAAMATADVFDDASRLNALEDALYPLLMDDFKAWAEGTGAETVVMESAILLQKVFFDGFGDFVLLVDAPAQTRRNRALERGNVSQESLERRMRLQVDERNNPRVDYIIENNGSMEELEDKVNEFLKYIDYGKREN